MVIIDASNPILPFCQFISKKSGLHLSMLSYNTETGEGVLAGQQKDERISLRDESTHRVFEVDKEGNVLRGHFNDKRIRVNILIPQTLYLTFKEQIHALELDPEYKKSIFIDYVREYRPEKPDTHKKISTKKANI